MKKNQPRYSTVCTRDEFERLLERDGRYQEMIGALELAREEERALIRDIRSSSTRAKTSTKEEQQYKKHQQKVLRARERLQRLVAAMALSEQLAKESRAAKEATEDAFVKNCFKELRLCQRRVTMGQERVRKYLFGKYRKVASARNRKALKRVEETISRTGY